MRASNSFPLTCLEGASTEAMSMEPLLLLPPMLLLIICENDQYDDGDCLLWTHQWSFQSDLLPDPYESSD